MEQQDRWSALSMKDKASLIKIFVDGGILSLDDMRAIYNEYKKGGSIHIKPENKGKFTATKKRTGKTTEELTHSKNPDDANIFWPGGWLPAGSIIRNIGRIGEAAGEMLANKEFAKKAVNWYKEHAEKIPDKVHKIVYDTLKDTGFSGNMSDIVHNVRYNIKNEVNDDNVFLMPQDRQQKALEGLGYKKIEEPNYGLVNAAVQKYKEATGREVPLYQKGEDEITRDKLIPLDNANLYGPTGSHREIITPWGDDGAETKIFTDNEDIGDTANTPTRYYRDENGNIYVKSWDFFDHGNYSRTDYNNEVRGGYVTRELTDMSQEFGNLLDEAGNPFVKTTGYKKVYPPKEPIINGNIENEVAKEKVKKYNNDKNSLAANLIEAIVGYETFNRKYNRNADVAVKDILEGQYDIKKYGGNLYGEGGPLNVFDGETENSQEMYFAGTLPEATVTAWLPEVQSSEGKAIAKNMAERVINGQLQLKDVPRRYQNYVQGETKGAIPMRGYMNKATNVALGTLAIPATAIAGAELAATAPIWGPYAQTALEYITPSHWTNKLAAKLALTADQARGIGIAADIGPAFLEGANRTINDFADALENKETRNEKERNKAALKVGLDVLSTGLDVTGAGLFSDLLITPYRRYKQMKRIKNAGVLGKLDNVSDNLRAYNEAAEKTNSLGRLHYTKLVEKDNIPGGEAQYLTGTNVIEYKPSEMLSINDAYTNAMFAHEGTHAALDKSFTMRRQPISVWDPGRSNYYTTNMLHPEYSRTLSIFDDFTKRRGWTGSPEEFVAETAYLRELTGQHKPYNEMSNFYKKRFDSFMADRFNMTKKEARKVQTNLSGKY